MDTGMELPTIRDAFKSPKNSHITAMDRTMARIMFPQWTAGGTDILRAVVNNMDV